MTQPVAEAPTPAQAPFEPTAPRAEPVLERKPKAAPPPPPAPSSIRPGGFAARSRALAQALATVAGVVPTRSPKPILHNVHVSVDPAGEHALRGTNLEIALTSHLLPDDVSAPGPATLLLDPARLRLILSGGEDDWTTVEPDATAILIRRGKSRYRLPVEDPEVYPEPQTLKADCTVVVAGAALRTAAALTGFATDVETTRYALGGVLVEAVKDARPGSESPDEVRLVGTDGRRLSRVVVAGQVGGTPPAAPVVPKATLDLIRRHAPADGDVELVFDGTRCLARCDRVDIWSRLVEGRFPRYQDVFPSSPVSKGAIAAGVLREAFERASIVTSDESRGVDARFAADGTLALIAESAEAGCGETEAQVDGWDGPAQEVTLDPRYVLEYLKALPDDALVHLKLIDEKTAVVLDAAAGPQGASTYVVMPLTKDR